MFEVDFKILNQKATPAIYADTLALRPAAGFEGRLFVATDSPYGVFRDTGTAWVQVASNGGGGGGSTGVNGLNGTTNIGLGGTLTGFTQILGGTNDILFRSNNNFTIDRCNNIDIKSITSSSVGGGRLNLTLLKSELFFGDNITYTAINLTSSRIKTNYGAGEIGLDLNYSNGLYTIGDFGFTSKKTQIRVDDGNTKIYFTTGASTSNTTPDLLLAENVSSSVRSIKLGDFQNYNNGCSIQIDDGFPKIFSTYLNKNMGFEISGNECFFGENDIDFLGLRINASSGDVSFRATGNQANGLFFNVNTGVYNFGDRLVNDTRIVIDDPSERISFLTENLRFSGIAIQSNTSGSNSGEHLVIELNGNIYKIELKNP